MDDILELNRRAWNVQASQGQSPWVQPVDEATIARARDNDWKIILTPTLTVPSHWFGDLLNKNVLGLASGGGQQVPIMAAAGAQVTSFDNSPAQLELDKQVATREAMDIVFEQGDMADLSRFEDQSFDLILHPVSNVFAPNILPVWRECYRVLRPGGRLLAGFMNPCIYLFDYDAIEEGKPLEVVNKLPYRDTDALTTSQLKHRADRGEGIEFSHSLDDQIGGQLRAGLVLLDFYEDHWTDEASPLNKFMPTSMATLSVKPTPAVQSELAHPITPSSTEAAPS